MDINNISKKNAILNNLFNDYLYCKKLSENLKKNISKDFNENLKIVRIKNNKLIIFVENNFIAAKLKIVLANNFYDWKKYNNYNFIGYVIRISDHQLKNK